MTGLDQIGIEEFWDLCSYKVSKNSRILMAGLDKIGCDEFWDYWDVWEFYSYKVSKNSQILVAGWDSMNFEIIGIYIVIKSARIL